MAYFFQINIDDVWAGTQPARHVNGLINHLLLMPQSRIFAIEQGHIGWMGWDVNTSILASQHNLIASLVGGFSKDVDVKSLLVRAPGEDEEPEPMTFPTIAEWIKNEAQFMTAINGG